MKSILFFFVLFIAFVTVVFAQEEKPEKKEVNEAYRVFLPSLELGYVGYGSEQLKGGTLVKTSIEYRLKLQNSLFFRLNYDNRDSEYERNLSEDLDQMGAISVVEGKARFSDLLLGAGYRIGESDFQFFGLVQYGVSFYNFPEVEQINNSIVIRDASANIQILRSTLGLEYYLDQNTALTLELLHTGFLEQKHFWSDNQQALGFAVGITTAM